MFTKEHLTLDRAVVIVGAGQAGARAAEALRSGGHEGEVLLIGDEIHHPYERPALSKRFLAGGPTSLPDWVQTSAYYDAQKISLHLAARVQRIDRGAATVVLADGRFIPYGTLVLAPGAAPRHLPHLDVGPVPTAYLRSLDDAVALRAQAGPGVPIVVAGGGLIGLELAATLTGLGCRVSVVEAQDRLLTRGLSRSVAAFLADIHRANGVQVITGRVVSRSVRGADGEGFAVLDDGTSLPAATIVVAIGVVPNTGLASEAGLAVSDGIVVDEFCRTGDPAIYAIGDATFQSWRGCRLESWANANSQAATAAAHSLGRLEPCCAPPWFWTDQFDLNVQVVGSTEGEEFLRGDKAARRFTVFHVRDARLLGATAVNSGRDIAVARRAIARAAEVDVVRLADPSCPLQSAFPPALAPS